MKTINAYSAKTGFSAVLREVRDEHVRFLVTLKNEPVAVILPVDANDRKKAAVKHIKAMPGIKGKVKIDIRSLIDEGRR